MASGIMPDGLQPKIPGAAPRAASKKQHFSTARAAASHSRVADPRARATASARPRPTRQRAGPHSSLLEAFLVVRATSTRTSTHKKMSPSPKTSIQLFRAIFGDTLDLMLAAKVPAQLRRAKVSVSWGAFPRSRRPGARGPRIFRPGSLFGFARMDL